MKNTIVTVNFCMICDDAMVADAGVFMNLHIVIDDGVGVDADICTELRAWVNNSGRVDVY